MPSIFEKYNLKQVINTSGRMTALGVSTPRPEVVEAAMAGMNQYFEMKDLVNKTGDYIAKLLEVEGATVVSCASAGIALSVAGVLVKDSDWLLEKPARRADREQRNRAAQRPQRQLWRSGWHHGGARRRQAS